VAKKSVPDCIPEDVPAPQGPACSWEPIGDRIIVARDPTEEQTPGGIVLPQQYQPEGGPRRGTVLAVGPGVLRQVPLFVPAIQDPFQVVDERQRDRYPMQIKVGDRVVISSYAEEVNTDTAEVVILRETEVLAIIR
jgi:co-chaperonin GroES (HSP10)